MTTCADIDVISEPKGEKMYAVNVERNCRLYMLSPLNKVVAKNKLQMRL